MQELLQAAQLYNNQQWIVLTKAGLKHEEVSERSCIFSSAETTSLSIGAVASVEWVLRRIADVYLHLLSALDLWAFNTQLRYLLGPLVLRNQSLKKAISVVALWCYKWMGWIFMKKRPQIYVPLMRIYELSVYMIIHPLTS